MDVRFEVQFWEVPNKIDRIIYHRAAVLMHGLQNVFSTEL
jgi:hypothetical protein